MPERWMKIVDPELFVDSIEVKTGYSYKQRKWFHRVYGSKCHFPTYSEEKGWGVCGSEKSIQIHHIKPQGWEKRVEHADPDRMYNGIAVCKNCHVGHAGLPTLDCQNEVVECIHPDMEWARRNYGKTDKQSYLKVFSRRRDLTGNSEVYWNQDFDDALQETAYYAITNYLSENPEDAFPK